MLKKDLTKDVKNRLNTVKGQLEGIVRMLDDDKDPELILNQFKAAGKALETAQELLIDEAFRKSLAAKISEAFQSCPGDCGQEDIIEMLRTQFPTIQPDDLTKKMKEIQIAYDQMKNNLHLEISSTSREGFDQQKEYITKRKIELFITDCPLCAPIIEMVKSLTCENCDVLTYNLAEKFDSEGYLEKLREYKITSLPAVVVNGKTIPASEGGISRENLISAGIGQTL